jgi:hypothetical protein
MLSYLFDDCDGKIRPAKLQGGEQSDRSCSHNKNSNIIVLKMSIKATKVSTLAVMARN